MNNAVPLIKVAEINPSLPRNLIPKPDDLVAFVPMAQIGEDGSISSTTTRPFLEVCKGYTQFCENDVLLAKITPCMENGKASLVKGLPSKVACGSTEFHVLRPREGTYPRYLFHAVWNQPFRNVAAKNMTGSAGQKRVPRSFLESYRIPLPPLAEQKRIASILDKADAIRRKLQQSLRLSDDFLRSVFLDMFGDPVTNPKGWKIGRMGDYSDQLTGYAFKSSEYVQAGEGVRLCRGANVLPGVIDWSDRADWPKDQCSLLDRFQLIQGDIVVAMDRPWISSGFKTARITEHDVPSLLVQRVARIRAKAPLSNNYLFSLLNQGSFARHCKPTETTIPHISPIELREFPVAIPSKTQLEKFDKIYLKLSHAKCAMQRKAHDSEHLFFSLQQRAFRGEL
jgi:type I restriction enzyme S subunit